MSEENSVDIDTFKRWSVPVLQKFLRLRNLSASGKKEELVALAFSASCMNIKPVSKLNSKSKRKGLVHTPIRY